MAAPTRMQRYYLLQIAGMRWFGAVFAGLAVVITCSNLPWLLRAHDPKILAINLVAGGAFFIVGYAVYWIGTVFQLRYRAHIAAQID